MLKAFLSKLKVFIENTGESIAAGYLAFQSWFEDKAVALFKCYWLLIVVIIFIVFGLLMHSISEHAKMTFLFIFLVIGSLSASIISLHTYLDTLRSNRSKLIIKSRVTTKEQNGNGYLGKLIGDHSKYIVEVQNIGNHPAIIKELKVYAFDQYPTKKLKDNVEPKIMRGIPIAYTESFNAYQDGTSESLFSLWYECQYLDEITNKIYHLNYGELFVIKEGHSLKQRIDFLKEA